MNREEGPMPGSVRFPSAEQRETIAWTLVVVLAVLLVVSLLTRPDGADGSASGDLVGDVLDRDDVGASTTVPGATTTQSPGAVTTVGSDDDGGSGESGPATPTMALDAAELPGGPRLEVGDGKQFATLQAALDAAQPGDVIELATPGEHPGPVKSVRDGTPDKPIYLTAAEGARLECGSPESGEIARCFELGHSYYVFDGFSVEGGSSNVYIVGFEPGSYVHDVKILRSTFRGARSGGTGECIRVKYQAYNVEIAGNDIADCGLGKCCDDSKNGEAVYIGTAPEQLEEKNPSAEPDETHDIWVHHNVMRPLNECVDIKEGARDNLVEHNTCSGQSDDDSGGLGSRGGRVGEGNIFRFNLVEDTDGACVRFGGDEEPDGTGNDFYGNLCRDIGGEYGVAQQAEPQGNVCGNRFEGSKPEERLSRDENVDPTAPCPSTVPMDGAANPGAG
jgi:hypothetical protein